MAYFKRGNWGYNPYKKYKSSSSGKYKANKQTRESSTIIVKCNHAFSASYDKATEGGTAAINLYDVLRNNRQFASFSALYDQVKINSISGRINVVDAETSVSAYGSIKTINIVTAWDRTGISRDNVKFYNAAQNGSYVEIPENLWDNNPCQYYKNCIGKGVVNMTGVSKSILNSFQRWTRGVFLKASSNEEKSCYLSTSNFRGFNEYSDTSSGYSKINEGFSGTNINDLFNSSNPCIPFESPTCKWKPTFCVGVFKTGISPDSNNISQVDNYKDCNNVIFNAEFSIECTFRNLKASL